MFRHIFINRLKCILRDRTLIFWTFVYPLILALFFSLAFSNLASNDSFRTFPIAVVDNEAYRSDKAFQAALQSVSDENAAAETKLFHITTPATEEEAAESLRRGEIRGYILLDPGTHVVVRDEGIQQTILKSFVDNYLQVASAYQTILAADPARAQAIVYPGHRDYLEEISPSDRPADSSLINFYALIAMSVLFGGFFGKKELDDIQADLSAKGARVSLAPVPKLKFFASSMCAALLMQFLSLTVLAMFLALVLRVNFGGQMGYVLLMCFVGSMMGISYGALVGLFFKKGKGDAALIIFSLLLSSAAGLQAPGLKYIIQRNVPALAYLNPANLVTDGLYSLYYYTTHARYFLNISLLGAFTVLFFVVVVLIAWRQKYASI
jgi:ABC-2 type transport system permease protein